VLQRAPPIPPEIRNLKPRCVPVPPLPQSRTDQCPHRPTFCIGKHRRPIRRPGLARMKQVSPVVQDSNTADNATNDHSLDRLRFFVRRYSAASGKRHYEWYKNTVRCGNRTVEISGGVAPSQGGSAFFRDMANNSPAAGPELLQIAFGESDPPPSG